MRLHQLLDGDAAVMPPVEWLVSRVCEEFGCLPSKAKRELKRDAESVWEIIRLRSYARAKEVYDGLGRLPDDAARREAMLDPGVQLVRDIEFELVRGNKEQT